VSIHTRQCPFQARRVPLANTGSGVRRRHRVQRAQQSGQPRAGSIFLESPTIEFQRNRVRPLHSPTYDPHPSNVLHSSESRHTCAKMIERTFVSRTCAKVRLPPCFLVLQFWVNDRLTYTQGGCYSPVSSCPILSPSGTSADPVGGQSTEPTPFLSDEDARVRTDRGSEWL